MTRFIIITCVSAGLTFTANAQSAKDIRGAAPVVQLASEPDPVLVVDQPLAEPLAQGRVVVQYRTENLRILPVYGAAAKDVSPRIGHLHITVDDSSWHWADASNEPLIINGFTAGTHKILVELADPTHKIITRKTITFTIPESKGMEMHH
jgi:hypothetical protein